MGAHGVREAAAVGGGGVKTSGALGKVEVIVKAKVLSASAAARARAAVASPVFSLGHERWVTCGFASGLTVSRAGHTDAVGRALRDASSVLALDGVNYFLAR